MERTNFNHETTNAKTETIDFSSSVRRPSSGGDNSLPPMLSLRNYGDSLAIRQEIQRFESVHPSIYAIYDLLDLIPGHDGQLIAQRIREHVVCIEESFVNSQEWTVSGTVPQLRLAVLGTIPSGKSALVHRYMTGTYMEDESPDGGRFKQEIVFDGRDHLLLIRDEVGPPEVQISCWVDGAIFVFSLQNRASFDAVIDYYNLLVQHRCSTDLPVILVGIPDVLSSDGKRVITNEDIRHLIEEMGFCTYIEASARTGRAVNNVFQFACFQMVEKQKRDPNRRVQEPSRDLRDRVPYGRSPPALDSPSSSSSAASIVPLSPTPTPPVVGPVVEPLGPKPSWPTSCNNGNLAMATILSKKPKEVKIVPEGPPSPVPRSSSEMENFEAQKSNVEVEAIREAPLAVPDEMPSKESTAPVTPNAGRKYRRNIFTPLSNKNRFEERFRNGCGRDIPVKEGYLLKKNKKTLNKDWKKKYVVLTADGCLIYHPTLQDYINDVNGKTVVLKHTTVKIPDLKPRCGRSAISAAGQSSPVPSSATDTTITTGTESEKKHSKKLKQRNRGEFRRNKFTIVSLENKQWHFSAGTSEERDEWVSAIEQQILSSLQKSQYVKTKSHCDTSTVDERTIYSIRTVPGNKRCIDCGAPDPEWASLNLGALICIDCCGVHRNLGSHISKVRSLGLDAWPASHVKVMLALGNKAVNEIWEYSLPEKKSQWTKPTPTSTFEAKEQFIRAKYERKEFLKPLTTVDKDSVQKRLIGSVMHMNIAEMIHLLAYATTADIPLNEITDKGQNLLHLSAGRGCLEICQLLIWYNIDHKALDGNGKMPIFYARIGGHTEIEQLLLAQQQQQPPVLAAITENSGTGTGFGGNSLLNRRNKNLGTNKQKEQPKTSASIDATSTGNKNITSIGPSRTGSSPASIV